VRCNDDLHHWGNWNGVAGDPRIYGRYYLATIGRGVVIGDRNCGTVSWQSNALTAAESAGSVTMTVTRQGGSAGPVTVDWATVAGTALAGTDYTAASGTLTWASGDLTSRTITVNVRDNGIYDAGRHFSIALSNPKGGTSLVGAANTTINLTNVDAQPISTIGFAANATAVTTSEAAGTVALTVTRTNASSGAATVAWQTVAGSALADVRFTAASGTLSWADGDTSSRTITVSLIDDAIANQAPTSFTVTLASPTGATVLSTTTATVTITDNETPTSTIGFDTNSTAVTKSEAAGTVALTVTRTNASSGAATVAWQTVAGSALADVRFTAASGTLSWADGDTSSRTITVSLINDAIGDQPPSSFTVTLTSPTGATVLGSTTATVTITDDDPPNIAITSIRIMGNTGGNNAQVAAPGATVATQPNGDFSVRYMTTDGSGSTTITATGTDSASDSWTIDVTPSPVSLPSPTGAQ
jgi:hypothetical protein